MRDNDKLALPGGHYCHAHQGNHSHYAIENCVVCKLERQLSARDAKIAELEDKWFDCDKQRLEARTRQTELWNEKSKLERQLAERNKLVESICDIFGAGTLVSTDAILTNIQNARRRSECLSRIESYHSTMELDDDGEEYKTSLLNWGESPEQYLDTYKSVIDAAIAATGGKDE